MNKNWQAVAAAITTRLAELGMNQQELAQKSRVSVATLRQMANNYGPPKRARTLAAVSVALGRSEDYLAQVLEGDEPADGDRLDIASVQDELRELRRRVSALEQNRK